MTSQPQQKIKEEKYLPSDELKYLSITEYIVKCISQNKKKKRFFKKVKIKLFQEKTKT